MTTQGVGGNHMSRITVSSVRFLSRMSPTDVVEVFDDYYQNRRVGVQRWKRWCQICASHGIDSLEAVSVWGETLRKWQAGRPKPLRRPEVEAMHSPPYLEEIHKQALVQVRVLGNVSLRTVDDLSLTQKNALDALWRVLRDITYNGQVRCVGITKAAMLLTEGRFGPAFDSRVREKLGLKRAHTAEDWLAQLRAIRLDLVAFEDKYGVILENLVPTKVGPLAVGRAYDVATWWNP